MGLWVELNLTENLFQEEVPIYGMQLMSKPLCPSS